MKYQYNRIESNIENNKGLDLYEIRRGNNSYITAYNEAGSGVERAVPYGGVLEKQSTVNTNHVARGSLNLFKTIAENHVVSGVAGMEASSNTYTFNQQTFVGWDDRTGTYDALFDHNQFAPYGSINESILGGAYHGNNSFIPEILSRSVSAFSNLGYSYKAKYNIEGSAKVDQATAFGINKRLSKNIYWAISGSWNIAKEDFFNVKWVDALKFRASLGKNGNLRRGQTTATTIKYGSSDTYTGKPDASIDSWGNPNLAPEETTTLNFGLDFTIFNRVTASFDVYSKQSRNLMVNQNTNPSYGLGSVYVNEGEISNKGVELSIKADVIKSSDFKWTADLNFSYNKNKVLKYGDRDETSATSYYYDVQSGRTKLIGEDVSSQVRFDWAGLNDNGDPQIRLRDGSVITYTDPEFANVSQDEMIATKPFIAPVFGGLNNILKYKNFTLNVFFTFKFGHVFQENLEVKYPQAASSIDWVKTKQKDVANAWKQAGDEATTDIPAQARNSAEFNSYDRRYIFTMSDYALHSAAHIRLKDITLWYELDKNFVSKIGFKRASLMFQARNLGLIWAANDADIDPESVPFSGREITFGGSFPQAYRPGVKVPASFVLGLKFEF